MEAGRIAPRMSDALAILDEAEAKLAPLSLAANLAWWESQVAATEENAERRTRAERAWSDALADSELYEAVVAARASGANGAAGRQLDLLHDLMLTHQLPDDLRARIVELESSVDLRFSRHRGLVGGVEVGDTEIKRILRRNDEPTERREAWEASKTVGAEVADDIRELARLRNNAARSLGHRDWFALSLSADELDEQKLIETLADCDRRHCRAVRALEGRTRRKPGLSVRLRRVGAAAMALRGSLLPGDAARRCGRPRPVPRRAGRGCAVAPHVRGDRIRRRRDPCAQRPVSTRRQEPARVLHRRRPARRRPHPRQHRADARRSGHDAPRARARRLRPRLPRRPAVAPSLDASRRDRGVGAPARCAHLTGRVARARARGEHLRGRRVCRAGSSRLAPSSFSSSRAGCSS